MSASDWFAAVIAFATVCYVGVTVVYTAYTRRLWDATKKNVDLVRDTVESLRRSTYGVTLQGIAENHRAIAFAALDRDDLQGLFMSSSPKDRPLDPRSRLFATALINHCEYCFEHCRFGTIPKEFEGPLKNDILTTFRSIPAVRHRWEEMRQNMEPAFRDFVDEALGVKRRERSPDR